MVLAVSWAITASVRPRAAAITSAAPAEEPPALLGGRRRPGCGAAAGPVHHGVDRRRVDEQRWSGQGLRRGEVGLDPGPVGGDGEVGVGLVGEGLVGAEHPPFDRSILGLARDRRDVVTVRHRGLEGLALAPPGPRPGGDREQRPQEVPLRGVLVEPARQVGDAGRDVGRGHHRACTAAGCRRRPGRRGPGPAPSPRASRARPTPCRPRSSRRVRAHATSNRLWLATPTRRSPRGGGVERAVEHRLEAGIDVGLARRRAPAATPPARPRPAPSRGWPPSPAEHGSTRHRRPGAGGPRRSARRARRGSRGGRPAAPRRPGGARARVRRAPAGRPPASAPGPGAPPCPG